MWLDDFLPGLPRPGWPDRRRAIALELLKMLVEGLVFLFVVGVFLGAALVAWASIAPAPK